MTFVRDWFSGELVERPSEGGGRRIIARETVHYRPRRYANPWDKGKPIRNRNMSIAPEQATPERIERENADARRHGTGAQYDRDGNCFVETRGQLNRELRRRGYQNNDAGYGDYAGR